MGGLMNDIQTSFENLSQEKISEHDRHSAKSHGSDYYCGWWS
eukprot:UN20035